MINYSKDKSLQTTNPSAVLTLASLVTHIHAVLPKDHIFTTYFDTSGDWLQVKIAQLPEVSMYAHLEHVDMLKVSKEYCCAVTVHVFLLVVRIEITCECHEPVVQDGLHSDISYCQSGIVILSYFNFVVII